MAETGKATAVRKAVERSQRWGQVASFEPDKKHDDDGAERKSGDGL